MPADPGGDAGESEAAMGEFAVPQRQVRVQVLLQDGRQLSGEVYVPETGPYGQPGHLIDRLNQESEDFLALRW